jgi:hypothetical protein
LHKHDEVVLREAIPMLGAQIDAWRARVGDVPVVLHDPATVLVAIGEPLARLESKRLHVDEDARLRASIAGPVQQCVAHVDVHATRARVRALVARG